MNLPIVRGAVRFAVLLLAVLLGGLANAADQTGAKSVNGSGCECDSRECCLCVKETEDNALQVKLSHKGDHPSSDCTFKVWLVSCQGGVGPHFDGPDGPQSKDIDCDDCWHCFTVWGGLKAGEYKVYVQSTCPNLPSACTECGSICVFPDDGPFTTELGSKVSRIFAPPRPPGLEPKRTYIGTRCGMHNEPAPLQGHASFGTLDGYPVLNPNPPPDFVARDVLLYLGDPVGKKNGDTIHLLGSASDDCGDRIEVYCHPQGTSSQFRLYYIDCHGTYYHVASCEWASASNHLVIRYSRCGAKKHFARLEWKNVDTSERSHKVNKFVFNCCTKDLSAQCLGNPGNTQVQFDDGYPDSNFAPDTLHPRSPSSPPRNDPPAPPMPPCPDC